MPGVGKTEIVRHFIHERDPKFPIVWMNGGSEGSIASAFKRISKAVIKFSFKNYSKEVYKRYASSGDILFVFDNVPDFQTIEAFLPKQNGIRIIITTRNEYCKWPEMEKMSVDVFSEDFALSFFQSQMVSEKTEMWGEEQLSNLVESLGSLPLALHQVTRHLSMGEKLCDVDTMLDSKSSKATVSSVFFPIVHRLIHNGLNNNMLIVLSYVNYEVVAENCSPSDANYMFEIVDNMKKFGVVIRNNDNKITIHPIMKIAIRNFLRRGNMETKSLIVVCDFYMKALKRSGDNETNIAKVEKIVQQLNEFLAHIKSTDENRKAEATERKLIHVRVQKLLHNLNGCYKIMRDVKGSDATMRRVEEHVANVADRAKVKKELAIIASSNLDYEKADALFREALHEHEAAFERDSVRTADVLHLLAINELKLNNYSSADKLLQDALTILTKKSNADQIKAVRVLHTVAITKRKLGLFQQSRQILADVLRAYQNKYGPESLKTLDVLHSMAITENMLANYKAADDLYLQIMDKHLKVYGENHPSTIKLVKDQTRNKMEMGQSNLYF